MRPGGVLVTDHDPQLTAYDWNWLGRMIYKIRLPLYRLTRHQNKAEQTCREATEIHHQPGRGIVPELYYDTLRPLGFEVGLFCHNNSVGARALEGYYGRSPAIIRLVQRLSGIDPDRPEAALSIMCIAKKTENAL